MGNLFGTIKELIKAQKSNFCSSGTRIIQIPKKGDPINTDDNVQYTICDGGTIRIKYSDVLDNFGIIPDCVQGGCPIISVTERSEINYLVDYGTNTCEEPVPYSVELIPCGPNRPNVYIRFNEIKRQNLQPGLVYYFNLTESSGCYTVGSLDKREPTVEINQVTPIQDCNGEGC